MNGNNGTIRNNDLGGRQELSIIGALSGIRFGSGIVSIGLYDNRGRFHPFGTGFIITGNRICTAAHVVRDWPDFAVMYDPQKTPLIGKKVIEDPQRDLAILSVTSGSPGLPMFLTHSSKIGPLRQVFYPGHPGGSKLVSQGVGIYTGRTNDVRHYFSENVLELRSGVAGVLFDGKVRPGNSGGPLVSEFGRVLGIVIGGRVAPDKRGLYPGIAVATEELIHLDESLTI